MSNACFKWEKAGHQTDSIVGKSKQTQSFEESSKEAFTLENVTFEVPKSSLCCIVGKVGSGKSSIFQGIIGEMEKTNGTVETGGSIAYCPQIAWVQNATLRDNILV